MNHSGRTGFRRIIKSPGGYTIIEAIIAIAVCGAGLAMILGLVGMAIKTEMVSKTIFEQSLEINCIADTINLSLQEESAQSLSERVDQVLASKYPNYQLAGVRPGRQTSLYTLEILHRGGNHIDKRFHIKVFWRPDE